MIQKTTLLIFKQRIKHSIVHDVISYVYCYLASNLQHYIYNLKHKKIHDINMLRIKQCIYNNIYIWFMMYDYIPNCLLALDLHHHLYYIENKMIKI